MNPPVRYKKDKEILWQRIKDGTIQCIATDVYAPHTLEESQGVPQSAECRGRNLACSMLTHAKQGKCSIEDVVKWMSTNVADCYQMIGKGKLETGYDGM